MIGCCWLLIQSTESCCKHARRHCCGVAIVCVCSGVNGLGLLTSACLSVRTTSSVGDHVANGCMLKNIEQINDLEHLDHGGLSDGDELLQVGLRQECLTDCQTCPTLCARPWARVLDGLSNPSGTVYQARIQYSR